MKYTYYTPYDVPSIVQGHRPWSGLPPANQKDKPREKEYSKGDKPEEIQDCLWCWLPECKNCLAGKKRAARPSDQIPAQFQADVLGGMKVTQLARKYKVGKATISRWQRQLTDNAIYAAKQIPALAPEEGQIPIQANHFEKS